MKKIYFIALLSANLLSNTPMVKKVITKSLKQGSIKKCHDKDPSFRSHQESFNTTIQCSFSCQENSVSSNSFISKTFSPQDLGLTPGDGSSTEHIIWQRLSVTLDLWSKNLCYQEAKNKCSKIKDFFVQQIKSGDWIQKIKLSCSNPKIMDAPFNSKYTLDQPSEKYFYSVSNPLQSIASKVEKKSHQKLSYFSTMQVQKSLKANNENSSCTKKAKLTVCYGDCLDLDSDPTMDFSQISILQSNQAPAKEKISICLDPILEDIKNLESKEKQFMCESFLWQYFQEVPLTGTTCAAFRYDHNCAKLF